MIKEFLFIFASIALKTDYITRTVSVPLCALWRDDAELMFRVTDRPAGVAVLAVVRGLGVDKQARLMLQQSYDLSGAKLKTDTFLLHQK